MNLLRIATFLVLVSPLNHLSAATGDWPQWRGPNRDGSSTETGNLKQWPAGGPKLAWKASGLGGGFSSIAIANNRIYTLGDSPDAAQVMALEINGGKKIWSTPIGAPAGHNKYPGTRSTPTVDGDAVYAMSQGGDVVCVEAATGKVRWKKNLERDFGGRMMSGWRYSESPLVDGNNLICTPGGSGGTLVALDKKTGNVVWRSKEWTDAAAYSSVVISEIGGVRQYVQLTGESVAGVAANDGKLLWKAARPGKTAVIPTPVLQDNLIYVTSGYNVGCNVFKVSKSGSAFSVEEVYAQPSIANHHGGVIRVGDHVYGVADNRALTCQNLKTGKIEWEERVPAKGAIAYADGHLYVRSESGPGTVLLVEATPAGYKEKGRFDQPDRSDKMAWPHPVVAGGKLYLRDWDNLLCYDVKGK